MEVLPNIKKGMKNLILNSHFKSNILETNMHY